MNVLYVNHTGHVSGGEKSLLEILRALPPEISPLVACPDGPLAKAVAEFGVERVRIAGTDGSLKLHPRHTSVALGQMSRAVAQIRTVARRRQIALTHANSIRAGLLTTMVARLGGPPTLAHVRDRLPPSAVSTLTLRAIGRADAVVANSAYTAASLTEAGVTKRISVLGNPVDLSRFDPARIDRDAARQALGISGSEFVTAVVGQITPWKGQEEAIRAVASVRQTDPEVKLLLIGSAKFVSRATRYDNPAYLDRLHRLVEALDLGEHVEFLGDRDDVPAVLRSLDALLVPSWEEPFGRSIIEAMAMQVPVIATSVGGPAEIITAGQNGLLVAPREPALWASAISRLIEAQHLQDRLARNGQMRARDFGSESHVRALVRLYQAVLGPRAPEPASGVRFEMAAPT